MKKNIKLYLLISQTCLTLVYVGDARDLECRMLGGKIYTGNVGFEVKPCAGLGVEAGVDVSLRKGTYIPELIVGHAGFSAGVGVATPIELSTGIGVCSQPAPIFKFDIWSISIS
jgi:hypothetical protein